MKKFKEARLQKTEAELARVSEIYDNYYNNESIKRELNKFIGSLDKELLKYGVLNNTAESNLHGQIINLALSYVRAYRIPDRYVDAVRRISNVYSYFDNKDIMPEYVDDLGELAEALAF